MDTIQQFEQHRLADGKAKKTIQSYLADVKAFHNYLEGLEISQADKINRSHITGFRNWMLEQEYKPATVNKAVNSLSSYTTYLVQTGVLPAGPPMVKPKQDRVKVDSDSEHQVEVFSEAELEHLLDYVDREGNLSARDNLIFHFLLYTGCRVSEMCNVKLADLDLLLGQVRILGKGGKIRDVPLRPDLVEKLQLYINGERQNSKQNSSPYLLVSQRADKLNRDTVNTVLEKVGKATNLKIYPHKLRHTFCTRLVQAGIPITTVSKLAGHADISTTANYYINTSQKDKAQAVALL